MSAEKKDINSATARSSHSAPVPRGRSAPAQPQARPLPDAGDSGPAPRLGRHLSLVLFSTATFLFWTSLYLYVPILPKHAESMGAGLSMVGAVIASYAIAQLLLRIPIGVLADSLSRRKPFVVGGLLFASLGAVSMAAASGPWLLFAGRATTGIAAATWVVSIVYFASYFPVNRSARGVGIISVVNSTAVVVGTSLGGALAQAWGAETLFFIAAGVGIVGALLLIPVPEPRRHRASAPSAGSFFQIASHPVVLIAAFTAVLAHFASSATISSFSLVYATRLGASSGDLGLLSGLHLGSATLATLAAVYLVERYGYLNTVVLGAAVMGAALLVSPTITDLGHFEGLQVVTGAGRGLIFTALMAFSISAVAPSHRATAMGVHQALYAFGMLAGPIVGGVAADGLGIGSVFYMSGASVFLAGGVAALAMVRRVR